MLESLENREMMDAGLGSALTVPPPGLGNAAVNMHQLVSSFQVEAGRLQHTLQSALPQSPVVQVPLFLQQAEAVKNQVVNLVNQRGRPSRDNVLGMASHLAQPLPGSLSALGNAAVGLRQQLAQGQVADLSGLSVTDALKKGSNWIIYEPKTAASGQY